MKKYEAMFIIKPDLAEDDRKVLFNQITESITKQSGKTDQSAVWAERRKLCFPIKKYQDGTYYLVNFSAPGEAIAKLTQTYKLNEGILRVLISALEK